MTYSNMGTYQQLEGGFIFGPYYTFMWIEATVTNAQTLLSTSSDISTCIIIGPCYKKQGGPCKHTINRWIQTPGTV